MLDESGIQLARSKRHVIDRFQGLKPSRYAAGEMVLVSIEGEISLRSIHTNAFEKQP
jgi:hypothetical protein